MAQQEVSREVQEIWELFREVARRQEELTKQQEETDREIRGLQELFTGQWGKLVESLVEPSVLKLFQARGIQVIDTAQRVKTIRPVCSACTCLRADTHRQAGRNGEQMEIDILATNEDSVIAIEVKTTLKVEDVNDFILKLERFMEFFPKYKGMKLYGAVAAIRIEEAADRYAYRKGLFVLTLSGEGMVVILNDERFKPKQW